MKYALIFAIIVLTATTTLASSSVTLESLRWRLIEHERTQDGGT